MYSRTKKGRLLGLLTFLFLLTISQQSAFGQENQMPADCSSYSSFVSVPNTGNYQQTLQNLVSATPNQATCIFLESIGTYNVQLNVPSRTAPLYIHGLSRLETILKPVSANDPIIKFNEAELINLAGFSLETTTAWANQFTPLLEFSNRDAIKFQFQDGNFRHGFLEFNTPGEFRLQGVYGRPCGQSYAAIMINHPSADFIMVGGNINNTQSCGTQSSGDYHHIVKEEGRLRVFDLGLQLNPGDSDFLIRAASEIGVDQIGYVRSEGGNNQDPQNTKSLLNVDASNQAVNVMLVASGLNIDNASKFSEFNTVARYSAAGTLWLIGNNTFNSARTLIQGTATSTANIVAMGNFIDAKPGVNPTNSFNIANANLYYASNLYDHCHFLGYINQTEGNCQPAGQYPKARHIVMPGGSLSNMNTAPSSIATPPALEIPDALPRPEMDVMLPGFVNVQNLGVVGDGVTNDTAAIKAIFNGNNANFNRFVYFPPGHYKITSRIIYNPQVPGQSYIAPGGWIAGPGADQVLIENQNTTITAGSGVFYSNSFAYFTIQGISFAMKPYAPGDPESKTFQVECNCNSGWPASQENMFYDVGFKGGTVGLSLGRHSPNMNSENMVMYSHFERQQWAMQVGQYNALNNILYNSTVQDVERIVHSYLGGTFGLFNVDAQGVSVDTFRVHQSANRVGLIHNLTTDAGTIHKYEPANQIGQNASHAIYIDSSNFTPSPATNHLFWTRDGFSLTIANTTTQGTWPMWMNSYVSGNAVFNLNSSITNWPWPYANPAQGNQTYYHLVP